MNVSIINIGDELLLGQVVNTNASSMSRRLIAAGMDVCEVATIADDSEAISSTLRRCLTHSDAVLLTGGLGPTKDDITKTTLCQFFDSELVENAEALANIKRLFDEKGYPLTEVNRHQAWVPRCCTMVNNVLGTAPCMWFEIAATHQVVVSMPGVPFEMNNLMESEVVPRLQQYFHTDFILNKNILVQGIGESFLSDRIEQWELALPSCLRLAYLPEAGMVKLRITARGSDKGLLQQQIDNAVGTLYPLIEQYIAGEDLENLPELVAQKMTACGHTLATAESCTGGALAARLTALPGASAYFKGGVVAYSNAIKEALLGVSHNTLETHGAVSEETVIQMAEGARLRLGADYALATSGIAGPTGGTADKPVGTVWIAAASPKRTATVCKHFGNDRLRTIDRTTNEAYSMLIKLMKEQ